jgi:predicted metal-dependent enzyme (double-stranded beta helix superfamily)
MSAQTGNAGDLDHGIPIPADFKGRCDLIARLDEAVRRNTMEEITREVQGTLTELIQSGALALPRDLCQPKDGGYARRLIYKSPDLGYTVVAMIWGPEQGTALHDHSGSWCVEGVMMGEIEVTQYELLEDRDARFHFRRCDCLHSYTGSAGSLIPPYEYHTIANPRSDGTSVTLHVYGRELTRCSIFEEVEAGWYEQRFRDLGYDN